MSSVPAAVAPVAITVTIYGDPAPKGSKRAFIVGKKGEKPRAIVTDAPRHDKDKLAPWKLAVTAAVQQTIKQRGGWAPLDGPLAVEVWFWLARPASAPKRVTFPAKKPDLDKLARAALDVLSKSIWTDDSRIVDLDLRKRFAIGRGPGAMIVVREMGGG